jgi:hypothetical protein
MQATITKLNKPNGGMAKSHNEIEGICCIFLKNLCHQKKEGQYNNIDSSDEFTLSEM